MKKCDDCNKTFATTYSLRRHIKTIHKSDEADQLRTYKSKENYKFSCNYCGRNYNNQHHYRYHMKTHEIEKGNASKDNGSKKCPLCEFQSSYTKNLTDHFKQAHDIVVKKSTFVFLTAAEVESYKSKIEDETKSCFVKKWSQGTTTVYVCHRSGTYTAIENRQRSLKTQGTNKINGFCPASFVVKTNEKGYISCEFTETHVGHLNNLGHLYLKPAERKVIAEKIAAQVPFDAILDDIREPIFDSSCNSDLRRHQLLTRKDLHNIKKSSYLHSNDAARIESWINEMNQTESCIVFYKLQGTLNDVFPELKEEDFVLIIMNSAQYEILRNYGSDCICLDRTHDTNDYNYELITLVAMDDMKQGFPCAFMITSRTDKETLKVFFTSIKTYSGSIRPKILMTDIDESFYNAWLETMDPPTLRLYCSWHIDRSWRENITKIVNKAKQVSVHQQLKSLMEEREESIFTSVMDELCTQLLADADTTDFGSHFIEYYLTDYKSWAYCYQLDGEININMNLGRLHKTLKSLYLDGKNIKRLDKAVSGLMKFTRDKLFERKSPNNKAKKIEDIRSRHKKSLQLSTNLIVTTENGWEVMSSSPDNHEMYIIKENSKSCDCQLVCSDCKVCIHRYSCSCPDSAMKGLMCKHIHLISRKDNFRNEESIIMIVDGDSEEINEDSEVSNEDSDEMNEDSEEIDEDGEEMDEDSEQINQEINKTMNEFIKTLNSIKSTEELNIVKKTLASLNSTLEASRNRRRNKSL